MFQNFQLDAPPTVGSTDNLQQKGHHPLKFIFILHFPFPALSSNPPPVSPPNRLPILIYSIGTSLEAYNEPESRRSENTYLFLLLYYTHKNVSRCFKCSKNCETSLSPRLQTTHDLHESVHTQRKFLDCPVLPKQGNLSARPHVYFNQSLLRMFCDVTAHILGSDLVQNFVLA